ncbi:MAG: hypothetical protein EA424_04285, partial [Planctomycetaceae bacterium]
RVAGPYGTGGEGAKIARMAAAATVGGTASAIGGGKFANGAWTAAFVSRFNHDSARNHVSRRLAGISAEDWEFIGQVEPGAYSSFDAGSEIALEFKSDAFPATQRWVARVFQEPLTVNGSIGASIAHPDWFRPITYTVETGRLLWQDRTTVLQLSAQVPSAGGHRWNVRIPPQATTHNNARHTYINVYRRREAQP